MARQNLLLRLILLVLFSIITMTSTASLKDEVERTNNDLNDENTVCATLPNACFASSCAIGSCYDGSCGSDQCLRGTCIGGSCGPCLNSPLRCCVLVAGNCTSPSGVSYGVCAPACG